MKEADVMKCARVEQTQWLWEVKNSMLYTDESRGINKVQQDEATYKLLAVYLAYTQVLIAYLMNVKIASQLKQ